MYDAARLTIGSVMSQQRPQSARRTNASHRKTAVLFRIRVAWLTATRAALVGLALLVPVVGIEVAHAQANEEDTVRSALESAASQLQSGRPRAALEALKPIEALEPKNPWLWYYRGLADLRLRNAYMAMADFDRALDYMAEFGDPDPQLVETVRHYRRRARREVFSVDTQIGLAYDTNVSYLGDTTGGLGLITGQDDGKFASGLQIHYAPIATEDHDLRIGARLGHAWHFEIDEFDYQDYGGSIRYARWLGDHWEASLQYDYDYTLLGNDEFLSNHAITPGIQYQWRPGNVPFGPDRTFVFYQLNGRDFQFDTTPSYDRDGIINGVGVEQSFLFRPLPGTTRTGDLAIGYRYDSISTKGTEFDRNTNSFYLGLGLPILNPWAPDRYLILPDKELVFRFNANWLVADYREDSRLDARRRKRDDLIATYAFSVSQQLLEDLEYGDLILHGIIHWTDADSSLTARYGREPFTYDKVVYGVQLEWRW